MGRLKGCRHKCPLYPIFTELALCLILLQRSDYSVNDRFVAMAGMLLSQTGLDSDMCFVFVYSIWETLHHLVLCDVLASYDCLSVSELPFEVAS